MSYNELLNEYYDLRRLLIGYYTNQVPFNFNSLKNYINSLEGARASARSTLKVIAVYTTKSERENIDNIDITLKLFVEYDEMYNMQNNLLDQIKMTCLLTEKGDLDEIYIAYMS